MPEEDQEARDDPGRGRRVESPAEFLQHERLHLLDAYPVEGDVDVALRGRGVWARVRRVARFLELDREGHARVGHEVIRPPFFRLDGVLA